MTSYQQDDLYERLIEISQEALVSGHYETAYHVLTAARHYAQDLGDEQRLRLVERVWLQSDVKETSVYVKRQQEIHIGQSCSRTVPSDQRCEKGYVD